MLRSERVAFEAFDVKTKVAKVLRRHPVIFDVYAKYGCLDMRDGFFSVMARTMSVQNAARIHRIPLDALVADPEQVITQAE